MTLQSGGSKLEHRGSRSLIGLNHVDGVFARLLLNLQNDGRSAVEPGQRPQFLGGVAEPRPDR